jgi:hypothetical protein
MCIRCSDCTDLSKPDLASLETEQLAALKTQLQQRLARVEARERVLEGRLRPQTLTDVELLEQKMVEALKELRARKEELQKEQKWQESDRPQEGSSEE